MRINYNTTAYRALNSLNNNDNNLSTSLKKLSSGLQVVRARDDPAGLAMSKRMNMQITGVSQASRNTSDGISITETVDGALTEVHDMLQRINQLAVKANNGTWTDEDREMMDNEAQQLMDEIERIARDTEFNGQPLLDGSWDLKGYATNSLDVKVASYQDDTVIGNYLLPDTLPDVKFDEEGNISNADALIGLSVDEGTNDAEHRSFTEGEIKSINGNRMTITYDRGKEIELEIKRPTLPGSVSLKGKDSSGNPTAKLELEIRGLGAMTVQTGANEHQLLDVRIPELSLQNLGLAFGGNEGKNDYREHMNTLEGADSFLKKTGGAIQFVSDLRSRIGAYQNRLEHTVNNLAVTEENMTSAYSRIMDVDIAEEMTEFTSQQVLTQAATSMLAQANQRPSEVLQLLQ